MRAVYLVNAISPLFQHAESLTITHISETRNRLPPSNKTQPGVAIICEHDIGRSLGKGRAKPLYLDICVSLCMDVIRSLLSKLNALQCENCQTKTQAGEKTPRKLDWGALSPLLQSFTASPGINTQQVGCVQSLAFKYFEWKAGMIQKLRS